MKTPEIEQNSVFASYTALSCIGQGGSAKVYSAICQKTGEKVALKLFSDTQVSSSSSVHRELRALSALKHPTIVALRDSFLDHEPPALCFELVEGQPLSEFQSRLPYILPELAVWIAIQVLRALEHAHGKNVIHRDLKPSNVLISSEGVVKVTDFGLAKLADASSITASGSIIGSPEYMSPEQAQGDVLTPKSDLFSLSTVLYFLVTGVAPFSKGSTLATLSAVSRAEFEPPHRKNPKVSWALSRLIERGLAKNPQDRYENATKFREALTQYLESVGLDEQTFGLTDWIEDPSSRTMDYLKIIGETLLRSCEDKIAHNDSDGAYEILMHLSLIAPASPSVESLQARISQLQNAKQRKKILLRWAPAALLAIIASGGYFLFAERTKAPEIAKTAPVQVAPAQAPIAKPVEPAKGEPAKTVQAETVKLDLPKKMRAFWDGRSVGPVSSFTAFPGNHVLRLIAPGLKPIEQKIKVVHGEPTVIRVRPKPVGESS